MQRALAPPCLSAIVSRKYLMKILTALLPFSFFACFGAMLLLGSRSFVKGAGPDADRRRRLIRVTGAALVVVMVVCGAGWLLSQK